MVLCCNQKRGKIIFFNDYVVDIMSSTRLSQITFKEMYLMLFGIEFNPTQYDKDGNKKIISKNDFLRISENFYEINTDFTVIHKQLFMHISEYISFENKISCEKVILLFLSLLKDTFSEKIVYFSLLISPYTREKVDNQYYYVNNRIKFFFKSYLDDNLIFFNKAIFFTLYSTFSQENSFLKYFLLWFYRCKNENMRMFINEISPVFEQKNNFMTLSLKYYLDVFSNNAYLFDFFELRKAYQLKQTGIDENLTVVDFNYIDLEDKGYSNEEMMKSVSNLHLKIENHIFDKKVLEDHNELAQN